MVLGACVVFGASRLMLPGLLHVLYPLTVISLIGIWRRGSSGQIADRPAANPYEDELSLWCRDYAQFHGLPVMTVRFDDSMTAGKLAMSNNLKAVPNTVIVSAVNDAHLIVKSRRTILQALWHAYNRDAGIMTTAALAVVSIMYGSHVAFIAVSESVPYGVMAYTAQALVVGGVHLFLLVAYNAYMAYMESDARSSAIRYLAVV